MELMNIFEYIKSYNLAFDVNSNWFQDLWYPLSKSQPPQLGGLTKETKDDEPPPRLDCKKITYQIGEHTETIDVQEEDLSVIRGKYFECCTRTTNFNC
ncbi:Signal peptide similar to that of CIV420R [Invertebrate iridescent virus 22]|uniref:Signal peptide similar to that of CIV420R n=1 Tax=Invertebrate iridescent virus 22 TaxID=345198 RepID=W8W1E1_9VIRU|nr:Signal peptide similar to that of CIV420R [Invertebrate iridescent virus 22]CCV01963.1 Signal peptide similar to that of CIV420R [Invertebrate iridescent virus 22]